MAEIKIEKKSPIWPWILLALLIAAIIIFFLMRDDDKEQEVEKEQIEQVETMDENQYSDDDASNKNKMREQLMAFKTFISNDENKMGIDHVYTHQAFDKLITAIKEVADNNDYDIETDLSLVKQKSDEIKKDPSSLKHANMIKAGFNAIVNTLKNMQEAKFDNLSTEINELAQTANEVKEDTPTLDQKNTIKSFFDQSAEVLTKMNNRKNN